MASRSRSPSRGRYRSRSRSVTPRSVGSQRRRFRSDSRSWSRARGREGREPSEPPAPPTGTKIVVERLSKNVREAHLREIFGLYGPIQDLDVPMNRTFGTNRGTAYILFEHREDAEDAIANLHEGQIDGAVINVSIVLPHRMFSPEPPMARRGANIDPRVPPPGPRGGHGPYGHPVGGGYADGGGPPLGGPRRRLSPPGRYGPRPEAYQAPPRSRSRSLSRSPPRGLHPRGGVGGYHNRSYDSHTPRMRSKSPPPRGGGSRYGGERHRRSRSRSYNGYAGRDRSLSPRHGYR